MFNWLTEIEGHPCSIDEGEIKDFRMRKIIVKKSPKTMSAVCQLFAAVDIINEESSMMVYPIPDEQARLLVMEMTAPHYEEIKETIIAGRVKEMNLFHLKPESRIIIEKHLQKNGYPAIQDLYRRKRIKLSDTPQKIKYYLINKEKIAQLSSRETEEVFSFFHVTFFVQQESILLQPTGWQLEDELITSYTIRTFSRMAGDLVLWVNENSNDVVGLEVYRNKIPLPIVSNLS
ncbi:hypothetical protein P4U90_08115 [Cytobacillus kochii]|uniref:hypothetical protein n=1 Tax=Cytobacillus kochii TaxID=859143 RepID=UPI002E1AA10A|nr:hypothetical protein [Cytobacillus kochii]